ncbi:hypothetical protein [Streptomyces sp. WMMB 714]|uniref:hypothetical protein n=1 Tax=Streptomyces sp. WMMB 714 TaxID=1286822 RepID=UPI000A9C2181|nr:hypothetical protein [Streptomyces sp. WMMB 714]
MSAGELTVAARLSPAATTSVIGRDQLALISEFLERARRVQEEQTARPKGRA